MKFLGFIWITFCFGSAYTQIKFVEVSDAKGLDYIYPGNDFQMAGGGLTILDVNNDGWEDLFQAGGVFPSKLWLNNKGHFEDASQEFGITQLDGYFIQGAIAADYDKDGYVDFVIANFGTGMSRGDKKKPCLMHNMKGKYFEQVSLDSILPLGNYSAACWGDVNKDGWIDLYLCNYVRTMGGIQNELGQEIGYNPTCFENKLLINHQGKHFTEEAEIYGVSNPGCSLAGRFHDVDQDGDLDLLVLNDFGVWTGEGNAYYANKFPEIGFENLSKSTGFDTKMYGMGVGIGDFRNDGVSHFYITNIGSNQLFFFDNGRFIDEAKDLQVDLTFVKDSLRGTSWTPLFFDADFDGDLDLFVSKGNVATLVPKTVIKDPNIFFENVNGTFIERGAEVGLNDPLSHRGTVLTDFDHDGDLDLISSVVKLPWAAYVNLEQKIKLFENVSPHGNYIAVKLVPNKKVNADAFGATVTFIQGSKKQVHVIDAGSGQASQSTRIVYFGLGKDEKLDAIEITWPDGSTQLFTNFVLNNLFTARQKN